LKRFQPRRPPDHRRMHGRSGRLLLATGAAFLVICGSAQAVITVGSPLTAEFTQDIQVPYVTTAANTALAEPGAHVASPVDGTIVRWHAKGSSYGVGGAVYSLEVLKPVTTSSYEVTAASPFVSGEEGLNTYTTHLPIEAGELIGLRTQSMFAAIPVREESGSRTTYLGIDLHGTDPQERSTEEEFSREEVGFNAQVEAAPTIVALDPPHGPPAGGTAVKITGTEFEAATAVEFGGSPAQSFTVDSDGQITATAPAGQLARSVEVTVTTPAGKTPATGAALFAYTEPEPEHEVETPPGGGSATTPVPSSPARAATAEPGPPAPRCRVPKLLGRRLAAAKKKLKAADCRIGTVKKTNGVSTTAGKVKSQQQKPGKVLAAGSKVGVRLG
jgi:hypothetical protein